MEYLQLPTELTKGDDKIIRSTEGVAYNITGSERSCAYPIQWKHIIKAVIFAFLL